MCGLYKYMTRNERLSIHNTSNPYFATPRFSFLIRTNWVFSQFKIKINFPPVNDKVQILFIRWVCLLRCSIYLLWRSFPASKFCETTVTVICTVPKVISFVFIILTCVGARVKVQFPMFDIIYVRISRSELVISLDIRDSSLLIFM